ncbi:MULTISPECIES: hypothetical protein [Pseudoalteromonas]|uniref:Uncharacterized protein n=2 Tax=Pseudoalteromonas TaxID=53246 RepID=V4HUS2_PSEL2|nr:MULTISPECIES: hypothetical protein [Pseudoalteromonas]ESP93523.1 hypothetical protein PL2TA16_03102 [Pseudoalteromonas luteoviolacea 2ta16]KZN42513.1 hypothetical protein N483_11450 [Pseudoalteromonas luteoviolacea NCIMB 1944]MBQ4839007.1 hypothetical protein [Pseudoalteromonas luteoviolacea]MCG7548772.1 hypothetical protein [Pseudoalteromonas sp. Of7M-16]MDK2597745.1 hypothetical protein [Pseudoalteromonas sp. P94(2023)]
MKLKLNKRHLKSMSLNGKSVGIEATPRVAGGGPNSAFCDTRDECDGTRLCTGGLWTCRDFSMRDC